MKKSKRKALTIATIVMMMMSLFSAAAFAAETPSDSVAIGDFTGGTVTINSQMPNDSFALYKVVDINYNAASYTVDYAFTASAAAYAETESVTIGDYKGFTEDQLKEFIGGYAAYVKDSANNVSADFTATATAGTATVTDAAMGQYLVLGTGTTAGPVVYQPMTATFAPDSDLKVNTTVSLTAKATEPGITKEVVKGTAATQNSDAAVGDVVNFKITMDVPTYPAGATNKTFKVVDTLSAGLNYNDDATVTQPNGLVLNPTKSENGKKLTWDFSYETIKDQTQVVITYTATVTEAAVTYGYQATNTAILEYGNDPYGESSSTPAESTVYTYGLEITKVDANDSSIKLAGVEFDVYKDSKDGDKVGTITTDQNGVAKLDGLALGEYTLVETKAATGYNIPPELFNGVSVTLADDDLDGNLNNDTDAVYGTQITNSKGIINLPTTGGIGTWIFTLIGIALLGLAAAFMLVMRRRQQSKA